MWEAPLKTKILMLLASLAAIAVIMMVCGCSAPESGTVVGKRYEPSWQYVTYDCMTYDTKGICTLRFPRTVTMPESWCLVLVKGEDEGCRAVDQVTYHKYQVGQAYP